MRSNLDPPSILQLGLPGTSYFPEQAVDFMRLICGYSDFEEWKIKISKYKVLQGILPLWDTDSGEHNSLKNKAFNVIM